MSAHIVYEIPLWGHVVSILFSAVIGAFVFWAGMKFGRE